MTPTPRRLRPGARTQDFDPLLRLLFALRPPFKEFQQTHDRNLTMPQFASLLLLGEVGALPPSAIADAVGLSRAATSQLVERLVQKGLVLRGEDTRDRRHKQITLSDGGRLFLDDLEEIHQQRIRTLWSTLAANDRRQAARHASALLRLLEPVAGAHR